MYIFEVGIPVYDVKQSQITVQTCNEKCQETCDPEESLPSAGIEIV